MVNLTKWSFCVALALLEIVFAGIAPVHAQSVADADFDEDGTVWFSDFVAFSGNFVTSESDGKYDAKYDLSGDGNVGFVDFVAFAGSIGKTVQNDTGPPATGLNWILATDIR